MVQRTEYFLVSRSQDYAASSFANFEIERTLEIYDSSVVLVQKFCLRDRSQNEENF
jgi:hypothetical protein